jgi:hypothetical protein
LFCAGWANGAPLGDRGRSHCGRETIIGCGSERQRAGHAGSLFALRVPIFLFYVLPALLFRQSRATALMLAAVEGHTAIVQTLIDAKADLNLPAAV